MRVGILGSGDVGKALASGFILLGHEVKIGSRDPEKLREWAESAGERASSGTFEEAAKFGDLIVLATLGAATENAIALAGKSNFDGKVVIDTTNPLDFSSGGPRLSIGFNDSLGERVQRVIPKARVVKAFNTVGNAHMVKPDFPGGPPTMFIAGNEDESKRLVSQICEHFGWDISDLGGIESSRYLEPMCLAWVLHGIHSKSWNHAFKLLKK
jgi:8-hydroxy-5-deazaflavin:NADPH oxidoreductase